MDLASVLTQCCAVVFVALHAKVQALDARGRTRARGRSAKSLAGNHAEGCDQNKGCGPCKSGSSPYPLGR